MCVLAVQKACDDVVSGANNAAAKLRDALHAARGIRVKATGSVGISMCTTAHKLIKAAQLNGLSHTHKMKQGTQAAQRCISELQLGPQTEFDEHLRRLADASVRWLTLRLKGREMQLRTLRPWWTAVQTVSSGPTGGHVGED